jgi:hypothetical protein
LEPPELPGPPLGVEEGTEDVLVPEVGVGVMPEVCDDETAVEIVLEREIVGGAMGEDSGSLPAAFASTGSNEPPYA